MRVAMLGSRRWGVLIPKSGSGTDARGRELALILLSLFFIYIFLLYV